MARMPVLISAAMLSDAKYVDRNGFLVNHLYGTVTSHFSVSTYFTRKPENSAAGNLENKNILNFKGCLTRFIKSTDDMVDWLTS